MSEFLSWTERTQFRIGELDSSGLMILGYCMGLIRGAVLTMSEIETEGLEDSGGWTVEMVHKVVTEYGELHEGNAALIQSIVKDWATDNEAL